MRAALQCLTAMLSATALPGPDAVGGPAEAAARESRGIWLDKQQMLEGREALEARLDRLKDAGFNTICVATQIRGAVIYPASAILPQYAPAAKRDPQLLDWLLPAIHQRGLRAEAWTEFGFYAQWRPADSKDPSKGAILDARPHLAAIDLDGKDHLRNEWGVFYSLCPSNPESQDLLIDLYVETVTRYDFDGISLDRIRYPEENFCYCPFCEAAFRRMAASAPAGQSGGRMREAWITWRKEQLTLFMERLSGRLRQVRHGLRITSAVVPPAMIDGKGQDWPTWLERGYLDAAMPMLYGGNMGEGLEWIRNRCRRRERVFIGLDAGKGLESLQAGIVMAHELGFGGVTIWYSGTVEPLLSELKRGPFKDRATSPLYEGLP